MNLKRFHMKHRTKELFYYGVDGIYMRYGRFKDMNLCKLYISYGENIIDYLDDLKDDYRLTIRQKTIINEVIDDLMTNYYKIN